MTTTDAQLKARIDAAYFTLMSDNDIWLGLADLPHEIWRDVVGYEGLYQVSNMGRVKSFKMRTVKILKTAIVQDYLKVCLSKMNESKTVRIHVLVAQAFLPNLYEKNQVNHIDGCKFNNRADNLEWCTPSENQQHALTVGLRKSGSEYSLSKLSKADKSYILANCIPGDRKFGFKALARMFNVNDATIANVYYGKTYKDFT